MLQLNDFGEYVVCNGYATDDDTTSDSSGSLYTPGSDEEREQEAEEEMETSTSPYESSYPPTSPESDSTATDYDYAHVNKRRKTQPSEATAAAMDFGLYYTDEGQSSSSSYNLRERVSRVAIDGEEDMEQGEEQEEDMDIVVSDNNPAVVKEEMQDSQSDYLVVDISYNTPNRVEYGHSKKIELEQINEEILECNVQLQRFKNTSNNDIDPTVRVEQIFKLAERIASAYKVKTKIEQALHQLEVGEEFVYGLNTPFSPTTEANSQGVEEQWEEAVLANLFQVTAEETDKRIEFFATEQGVVRYMQAIRMGGVCLTCHGASLTSSVEELLDSEYPRDRARGYGLNELRGAFSITWPKAFPSPKTVPSTITVP